MKHSWKPWRKVVGLRDDLKTGELPLAVFAADLYDVVMQKGQRPVYEDPDKFFALTHLTHNLRELLKDVVLRLAGQSDKAYRRLSVNYGGGKTHTLIALRHLVHNPSALPDLPAVQEFEAYTGFKAPKSRIAALCFDKIDLEKGVETPGPEGETRMLKYPWSILAFQLAGAEGLRLIHSEGEDAERATPPAEPLVVELLSKPQEDGLSTLVLLDEALMYIRVQVEADPSWRGRIVSFFQYLTQAVVKVDHCAMVASLLASDPRKYDDLGNELLRDVLDVFSRQMEEGANPVSKEDVAEILRRRFFKHESIHDTDVFRPHVTSVAVNIAAFDKHTKKNLKVVEERYLDSYPFHPDLIDIFYTRWTQLDGFQRTRGILRTFAIALRDAEKWDTSPLVGPNVFLSELKKTENELKKTDLSEAASELASLASVDTGEGKNQEWHPILESELEKARMIQSEVTGLRHREMEQAVISVFLSSQPIGQKALTQDLIMLLGAAKPDKIDLEKALHRWTELSWFLDEVEVATGEASSDGDQLPKAWRLGNRPNLRQMHHEACNNRVLDSLVESQTINAIEKLKTLTSGASAAGARVHTLPKRPRDVADDGKFHYCVLGPEAASESGKPSAEAKRFINETTESDRPRVYRNAIVLAVPSKDGLDATHARIREYLGWEEVHKQLKNQSIDPIREQMLEKELQSAKKRIPDAVKQAYSIVVTVNENNEIHAFKIVVTDEHLFITIKADKRTRIQETAISSEAMLPDGPYDLWREGEQSRRLKDIVGAFAQFTKLPKMLRSEEILDTVVQGVQEGIWVAQVMRPDKTIRTFWRTDIDEIALKEPSMEVLLPEFAILSELAPELLEHQKLPGLWTEEAVSVQDIYDYFAGGRSVSFSKDGYEETLIVPKCEPTEIEAAISQAVENGILWLTNGPASILREPIPAGVFSVSAMLKQPPESISFQELMGEKIPEAWKDDKTTALAIMTALSALHGVILPWFTVCSAIEDAIRARWLELSDSNISWPCDITGAQNVILQIPVGEKPPEEKRKSVTPKPQGMLVAEAVLEANGIQDLADQIPDITKAAVGNELKFNIRVEFGGQVVPDSETVRKINKLLLDVSDKFELN